MTLCFNSGYMRVISVLQDVWDGLEAKGHNVTSTRWVHVQSVHNTCMGGPEEEWYSRSQCIDAAVDFRKAGKPDGF